MTLGPYEILSKLGIGGFLHRKGSLRGIRLDALLIRQCAHRRTDHQ